MSKDVRQLGSNASNSALVKMAGNGMHLPSCGFVALVALLCLVDKWPNSYPEKMPMATRWMWACQISLDTKTMKSEDKTQILDYVLNVCYLDGKCILDSEKKTTPCMENSIFMLSYIPGIMKPGMMFLAATCYNLYQCWFSWKTEISINCPYSCKYIYMYISIIYIYNIHVYFPGSKE